MSKCLALLVSLQSFAICLSAQTVPVTFHLDASHAQYQTVQLWNWPNYYDYHDTDGDRIFELTLDLQPGTFYYYVLRDNAWGWDPDNPVNPDGYRSNGSSVEVKDPMITYLVPMNGDLMRESRIRADLAYSPANPPKAGTLRVMINGNSVPNPENYFNAVKRNLIIENPSFLTDGLNTLVVTFQTNKGSASRTSQFIWHPIGLMIDRQVYRMDNIPAWGRVFTKPYPTSVFLSCNQQVYEARVNTEGYFGSKINLQNGQNIVKTAFTEAGLATPTDQMTLNAELRHKWWVELAASVSGGMATITSTAHDINAGSLTLNWGEEASNPAVTGVSGTGSSVSFALPTVNGEYLIRLQANDEQGNSYTARKMLIVKNGNAHFTVDTERAPWMKTMMLYEVEMSYFENFTFQNLKKILPHMKETGLNAFRITPFVAGGFVSWDHFDIHPPYGSKEDLKDLIETAHQAGIRVIFDIPLGHTCSFHPYLTPNFLLPEASAPFDHFHLWKGTPGKSDIVHSGQGRNLIYIDLDNSYSREYIIKLFEFWMEEFGADGFRYDSGQESVLRSPEFMVTLLKRLKNIKPDCWLLVEGDNRDNPEVNFYDYGDSGYDWRFNSEWNGDGLPAIFKGNQTVDKLHSTLSDPIPANGLIMRYANTGYHDYLHQRYGWEQERTAFAIVSTYRGVPNVFQGEEVGAARANGMFDYTDPLNCMPFYTRLIGMRKSLLGNYPSVTRLTQQVPANVYAYLSKNDTAIVLTAANLSGAASSFTIDLNQAIFDGKGRSNWMNVVKAEHINLKNSTQADISLKAWETHVFVINARKTNPLVTFQVNMRNDTVSSKGIFLKGGWDNWAGTIKLDNPVGKFFTATLPLTPGVKYDYKYYNGDPDGNWWESKGEDLRGPCTDEWTNRSLTVPYNNLMLEPVCFNSCTICPAIQTVKVKFQVDMRNEIVQAAGVHLSGSFCNWSQAYKMTAEGKVYSYELELKSGDTITYKFINGDRNNWGQYEIPNGDCVTGANNDRILIVPYSDGDLPLVCFNRCVSCTQSVQEEILESIRVFPNPASNQISLDGLPAIPLEVRIYNLNGQLLMLKSTDGESRLHLELGQLPVGRYSIIIQMDQNKKTFPFIKE